MAPDIGIIRLAENPIAVPRATGNRIDAAGLANSAAGSVREGMNVVIVAILRWYCQCSDED